MDPGSYPVRCHADQAAMIFCGLLLKSEMDSPAGMTHPGPA
jgi:hypothetical protein